MDNQSSWTKGLAHDKSKSSQQATYQNSFEFLDMSSCDESQKLKLKTTLEMPPPQRDRYRIQVKEPENTNSKEVSLKTGGEIDRHFQSQPLKEASRGDSGRAFNKNMSPPTTNFQTNTTSTTSSSGNNMLPTFQYGSHQPIYPQMYPHMDHQNSRGVGRRGRPRGGSNSNRRDFQNPRQHNHQQNDFGQPLLDQNQILGSQYQPFYIHYPPWQNTIPQNLNMTQNLTGQPLFAIQPPLVYQYGSPYPIMYNLMPQAAHPMPHHQEMVDNEVQDSIPWQDHSQPIYHHSPLLNNDFPTHSEEFQMINNTEYQQEEIDPEITFVDVDSDEKELEIIEKTQELTIEPTTPLSDNPQKVSMLIENGNFSNTEVNLGTEPDSPESVPNFTAQQKKQTASVSVSAIPNKDVRHSESEKNIHTAEILQPRVSSFSSITAANHPNIVEHKKTENNQTEKQQSVLIERAKQQIVTTIIGSNKEGELKEEDGASTETKTEQIRDEKPTQAKPVASNLTTSSMPTSSWAGLFSPKPAAVKSPQSNEPQKPLVATNSDVRSNQASQPPRVSSNGSQVPGTMSYSAVSSVVAKSLAQPTVPSSAKTLPQTQKTASSVDENSNNKSNNDCNPLPLDQSSLKLGEFFSSYKIESNSIAVRPRGLLNKSNYCYINAILQALVSCPPFYHLMKAIPPMPMTYRCNSKTPVTDAMVELVSNYSLMPFRKWTPREKGKKDEVPDITRDTAFEPLVILKMLQTLRTTEMFPIEGRQEDAEEFLSFILNRMNDEMIELKKLVEKPKELPREDELGDDINGNSECPADDDDEWQVISGTRNKSTITRTTDFGKSPISDIFGGKLKIRVHREGDHSSDNIEPFFTLKLVIEKASSVREALEILVGRDQLEGVLGRTNQEVAAWQQVTLEELPVVLILHLKCFDFKKDGCSKILKTVEFPIELKLDQKLIASKNKYQQKQKQYKLFAVVYHDGKEASKGHYITDVFHINYNSWIRYDDSSVKAVTESNVLHPKNPRVPYLLFYRRADTIGHTNNKISTK